MEATDGGSGRGVDEDRVLQVGDVEDRHAGVARAGRAVHRPTDEHMLSMDAFNEDL
jgi:hypothetical protein